MLASNELNDLRQAVLRGEEIPREKYREIIASLRTKRAEDIASATEAKAKKAKAKTTSDEELAAILGL